MPQAAQMSPVPDASGPLSSVEQANRLGLEQSFALFSQMSSQLTDSYSMLEARVTELKGELEVVSAQRMQELAEKERLANRLQNLLDLLPGGVIVIDAQGIVREANPAACELLGLPLEGELWRQVIARCFAPREDDGHEISLKDGRRLSISTRSLDAEPGQLVLLNDLTETRHLQDQLARHERLSSLGRMVASLAHQIRTPLSAALLYASHLAEQELPVATQQRFAGRLKERLHELEHQVRDMLIFARGELPLTDRVTPKMLMQSLQAAAQAHVRDLPIRWQCYSHAGELLCNRDTLVGAILNLIENAIQASAADVRLKVHLYARGSHLRVAISDSGSGIDPHVLARLGEPFFTTKATGTGLGLTVVKAVARAHQGELLLRSRPGRGTCAQVILPLFSNEQPPCRSVLAREKRESATETLVPTAIENAQRKQGAK
jgi:two-component system, sensor histidine kinase FlrB